MSPILGAGSAAKVHSGESVLCSKCARREQDSGPHDDAKPKSDVAIMCLKNFETESNRTVEVCPSGFSQSRQCLVPAVHLHKCDAKGRVENIVKVDWLGIELLGAYLTPK